MPRVGHAPYIIMLLFLVGETQGLCRRKGRGGKQLKHSVLYHDYMYGNVQQFFKVPVRRRAAFSAAYCVHYVRIAHVPHFLLNYLRTPGKGLGIHRPACCSLYCIEERRYPLPVITGLFAYRLQAVVHGPWYGPGWPSFTSVHSFLPRIVHVGLRSLPQHVVMQIASYQAGKGVFVRQAVLF